MADFEIAKIAYYKTGGQCAELYRPRDLNELEHSLKECESRFGGRYFFLGAGSNSLVTDQYWSGAVVVFSGLQQLKILEDGVTLCVGAGVENKDLVEFALLHRLSGVEWMFGLPGQVGGTVRMNARCYGGEISQVVTEVTTVSAQFGVQIFKSPQEMFRGYKDTYFMDHPKLAVAEANFRLKAGGNAHEMKDKMHKCLSDRESKKQFSFPSAGCVFKNDYSVGVPSGMLIEASGLKGKRVGKAQVSMDHANFVYNLGGATSDDILSLSILIREKVWQEFGVWMAFEMEVLGAVSLEMQTRLTEVRKNQMIASKIEPLLKKFSENGHTTKL